MSDAPVKPAIRPHIQVFALGDFQTNCLVVTRGEPTAGDPCWIVDCGYQPGPMLDAILSQGLVPEKIILTHAHADHIAGLSEARSRFPEVPIVMHRAEESWMSDPMLNLSAAIGLDVTAPVPDSFIDEGDTLTLGDLRWSVLHTPGHSPGGISLLHEPSKTVIVGDTLFAGSIGRTDFPGSSFNTLIASIRDKLYQLDNDTVCYPGHGPRTKIGREINSNPFVHE